MQRCLFETSVTLKFSATAFEGKETRKRLLICVLGWRPAQSSGFFVISSHSGSVPGWPLAPATVRQAYRRIVYWLIPTHVTFGRGHH